MGNGKSIFLKRNTLFISSTDYTVFNVLQCHLNDHSLMSLIDEPVCLLIGGRFCRQVRLLWSGSFNRKRVSDDCKKVFQFQKTTSRGQNEKDTNGVMNNTRRSGQ